MTAIQSDTMMSMPLGDAFGGVAVRLVGAEDWKAWSFWSTEDFEMEFRHISPIVKGLITVGSRTLELRRAKAG